MEITNFTLVGFFIPKIIHSYTCSVWFEYLNKLLLSFANDFTLNGMGLDNDFRILESSTAGGLGTDNLVPTLLVVSQPVRMCFAKSTVHYSGLMQRDILCRFKHLLFVFLVRMSAKLNRLGEIFCFETNPRLLQCRGHIGSVVNLIESRHS